MTVKFLDQKENIKLDVKENTCYILAPLKTSEKYYVEINLEKASVEANLLYADFLQNKKSSLEVKTNFLAPETKVNVQIRTVLAKKGGFKFKGTLLLPEKVRGCTGTLDAKGLIAGQHIEWEVEPILEIANDKINVNHKATLIPFNKRQLNYLKSRGLTGKEARETLTQSFLSEIEKFIPEEEQNRNIMEKIKEVTKL